MSRLPGWEAAEKKIAAAARRQAFSPPAAETQNKPLQ
jgi:hypothetical protein